MGKILSNKQFSRKSFETKDFSTKSFTGGPVPMGTLITDNFDRTTGLGPNYTTVGGATWDVSDGSNLVVSGGAINFTTYARYSAYASCLQHFSQIFEYNIGTVDASSMGIAIGPHSINPHYTGHVRALLVTDTGSNSGKVVIYQQTTPKATSAAALSISSGDEVRVVFTRVYNSYTVTAENLTTPGSVSVSYTFATTDASGTGSPNNTCNYALYAIGGTQTVRYWSVSSDAYKNVKTCLIGNSIATGKRASIFDRGFAALVNYENSNDYTISAGGGDTTQQVLDRIDEVKAINAENYLIMICGNDIEYGVATATWQANYDSIVSQLKATGANVIHLIDFARSSVDITPIKTYIDTNYASDVRIDLFTRTKDSGTGLRSDYDIGDGIHLSDPGHRDGADYIIDNAGAYIPTLTENLDVSTSAHVSRINAVTTWNIGYTWRQIYNNLITYLKDNTGIDGVTSLWDSSDVILLYNMFEENGGLLNIKSASHDCTKLGGTPLTFRINSYYDGNGSGYLNTNFNPGDGGSYNWTQNDAAYGVLLQNNAAAGVAEAGALNGSNLGFSFNPRDTSDRIGFRMNGGSNLSLTGSTNSSGHWLVKVIGGTTVRVYRNGVQFGSDVAYTPSVSPVNLNIFSFCSDNNGTAGAFTTRNKYGEYFGSSNLDPVKMKTGIDAFYSELGITI